jgi:hypothetical protein
MYERSGAPRRWESRTESEREGVRVAPGPGLVRDRVERVALLAMQSSPAPLPGDEVAGGTSVYVASVAAALAAVGVSCDIYTRATSPDQPVLRDLGPGVRLVSVEAGPLAPLGRTQLVPLVQTFTGNLAEVGEDLGPYQLLSAHWWLSGLAGLRLRAWWRVPMEFRPHSLALARNRALVDLALARSPARSQCEARIIDRADLLVAGSESESAARPRSPRRGPDGSAPARLRRPPGRHQGRRAGDRDPGRVERPVAEPGRGTPAGRRID